jgi:hypothetical protein
MLYEIMFPLHLIQKMSSHYQFIGLVGALTLIFLSDAIIAYTTPVFIEGVVHSTVLLGFVYASSSLVGLFADFYLPTIFAKRHHFFFLYGAVVLGIGFVLTMLYASPTVFVLFTAMATWGLYFECMRFGQYHLIHAFIPRHLYVLAWGILGILEAAAYTIGPVIATELITINLQEPYIIALLSMGAAAFLLAALSFAGQRHRAPATAVHPTHPHHPFINTVHVWKILGTRLWPLLLFVICMGVVDATFWTTGALLSESFADQGVGLLLTAYTAPLLFIGVIAARVTKRYGKKRTSLAAGAVGGVLLVLAGITTSPVVVTILIFFVGTALALAWPALNAAFEDYMDRLMPELENDLVGLRNAATSIAFIIGPIIAGIATNYIGAQRTLSIVGVLLCGSAVLGLSILPRKVHMPQHKLQEALS